MAGAEITGSVQTASPAPTTSPVQTASPAIAVTDLHKHYRVYKRPPGLVAAVRSLWHREYEDKPAVRGLSFRIAAGERVGFLGPNGAGKTTTLKMLAGLLHPSSGRIEVVGHSPQGREVGFLQQITLVMGQKQQLLWDLPPVDTFELNRAVYSIPRTQYQQMLSELTELLELAAVIKIPTRQLSLGERMKCELVAALLHRPQVLFLDEPTIGLDVSMQVVLRRFIRAYNERYGATVLLTSHYMQDVQALCPRVLVIDQGQLRYDGDLLALARTLQPAKRVTVRLAGAVPDEALQRLGTVISTSPTQAVLQVGQSELRAAIAHLLDQLPVTDLTVEDPPLEEVMRDLFARPAARPNAADAADAAPATEERR
jgi:ABC-2 type transport system ATP-binding protein